MKRRAMLVTLVLCFILVCQLTTCLGSSKVYGKNKVSGYGKVDVSLLVGGYANVYTKYTASYYTIPSSSTPTFKYADTVSAGSSFCTGFYFGSWSHLDSWATISRYNTAFDLYTRGMCVIGVKSFGLHYTETLVQKGLRVGDNYY